MAFEGIGVFLAKKSFNVKERMRLWRKLAVQVHNNLPVYAAFDAFLKQARKDKDVRIPLYERVLRVRDSGGMLGAAFVGWASPEEVTLLYAGERAGDMEMGFKLCYDLLENKGVIAKAIKSGLAYPSFLTLICIGMMIMVSRMIIPQLGMVYDPMEWTGAAGMLRDIAWFVNSWKGVAALCAFIGGIALMVYTFPRWTGPSRKAVDDFGPWGIYKTMTGSSWLFSVAVLMRSGMQLRAIFDQTLADSSTSKYLKERIRAIAVQYSYGKNFGESLYDAEFKFPSKDAVNDMLTYSALPNMEEHMFEIAKDQMQFDVEAIKAKMKGLNVMLMFFVFGFIGLTLYGVFSFQQQFASTM